MSLSWLLSGGFVATLIVAAMEETLSSFAFKRLAEPFWLAEEYSQSFPNLVDCHEFGAINLVRREKASN